MEGKSANVHSTPLPAPVACLPEADGGSENTARSQCWCCVETQSWVRSIINKNLNGDRASPVLQRRHLSLREAKGLLQGHTELMMKVRLKPKSLGFRSDLSPLLHLLPSNMGRLQGNSETHSILSQEE